jgi:hypothetical protein
MPAYPKSMSSMGTEFAEARTHFEGLIEQLRTPGAMEMTHDQLETLITKEGRECLRRLYQGHLDMRAAEEQKEMSVRNAKEEELTHRRKRARPLLTVVGKVTALRTIYSSRRGEGLAPLDAELNLPEEIYSHGLRNLAAIEAARGSYDAAVEAVERATGNKLPKRQLEELARRAAQDFDAYYARHEERPALASVDALLILSLDGKGVVMRQEALRAVTMRRAQRSKHKLETRLSTGEKRDRKRMSTVAAIYDVAPHIRRAEDILPSASTERPQPQRPRPRNKRVWASLQHSSEQVTQDLFAEALRRDPEQRRRWVVLVDGDRHQIARVEAAAKQAGMKITLVIDFIHVLEYLWKAAWGFFDKGDPSAEAWVLERARRVLEGKSSDVAAGIGRSATLRAISAEKRISINECIDYLKKKRTMLRYNQYLVDGLPISTGVIEGACRHLVVDRMDITGARWSLEGAEAILRLRSLRSSGDFDNYWRFHLACEHRRVHLAKYAKATP